MNEMIEQRPTRREVLPYNGIRVNTQPLCPEFWNPSAPLSAILIGLVIVAIGFALGTNSGYAINPARDFGPRLMEFMTGYQGAWRDQYGEFYFWVPIVGPLLGGLIGGGLYEVTVGRSLPKALESGK